jgi:hypothetical protein
MTHATPRPFTTFFVLACACGAYMGVVLWLTLGLGYEDSTTGFPALIQILVLMIPAVVCAAVQFRQSKLGAVSGPRLWFHVAGAAIGAPLVGMWMALVFIFVLFGKSP